MLQYLHLPNRKNSDAAVLQDHISDVVSIQEIAEDRALATSESCLRQLVHMVLQPLLEDHITDVDSIEEVPRTGRLQH